MFPIKMRRISVLCLVLFSLRALDAKVNATQIAAYTTIAVNALTIKKTVSSAVHVWKVTKHGTAKVVRKVVGK